MPPHGDPVEDQIRDAIGRGQFDNLPGAGKPLDLGEDDDAWWVKRRIDEMRRHDALVERTRAIAGLEDGLWILPDVASVRARVAQINFIIDEINRDLDDQDRLSNLNPDQAVATWTRMFRLRS